MPQSDGVLLPPRPLAAVSGSRAGQGGDIGA